MTRKENLVRTIVRDSPAWIPHRYDGSLTLLRPAVVARPVEGGPDDWGVNWIATTKDEGSYQDGIPVIGIDEVDDHKVPETDWVVVTEDLRRQVSDHAAQDTLLVAYDELILFERAQLLLGGESFLAATILEPEKLCCLLDKITAYQQKLTEAIMKSGVAGVRFTDDWGMQTSLFIAPDAWRALIKPRLAKLYAVVKDHGGYVFQHSCGHIDEIVPDLVEMGLDVLDPCQPAANDIKSWKSRYGDRLSFMGGLDTQGYLSFGSADAVRAAVAEVVPVMARGGGFIPAPSHTITIPDENRQAMLDAIADVNRARNHVVGSPPGAGGAGPTGC